MDYYTIFFIKLDMKPENCYWNSQYILFFYNWDGILILNKKKDFKYLDIWKKRQEKSLINNFFY